MENLDSWQLLELNSFEEACKKADEEYQLSKNIPSLRHKVWALFHLSNYNEALTLAEKVTQLRNGETDDDFISSGIALWALNKREEAIIKWKQAEKAIYTDAAGGVELQIILYFAAIRTNNEALKQETIKKIKKLLKSKRAINWPAPLALYILGNLLEEQLRSYIVEVPILKERQLCQSDFVVAIRELENNEMESYKSKLQEATSYGSSAYLEQMYYLAKGELEILQG